MGNLTYSKRKSSEKVFGIVLYFLACNLWLWALQLPLANAKKKELHIGGIFPINGTGGWQGGQACEPAAQMAFRDINKNKDLLAGYTLTLHPNDSECEPGRGAAVMYELLYNEPVKVMLLAGCSTVCTTVAEAAKKWNLIVLCYGASSPALSNRQRFETLFRTHPSATVHNPTRIFLMQKFGWSRVAILQQAEEVFISTVEDLEERCKAAKIEIVTRQSFLTDPTEAVRNLKRQDARIVVGLFYVVAARRVLCEIYRQQLYGKKYVWFFIGWYEDNWYEMQLEQEGINCTREQMKMAAEGHLTTEAVMWNQDNGTTISGMTKEDFRTRLHEELKKNGFNIDERLPEGYQEAPLAYDAVWALALAFNKTIEKLAEKGKKLEDFSYTNRGIRDEIYNALNTTSFLGVSGRTAFSEKGDRIALTQVEQMVNGKYNLLGYYDTENLKLKPWHNKEQWINGKVPQDRTIEKTVLRKVSLSLFISMSTVAGVGIVWAILLILFTYIYRDRKVIELSHPVTNTLMLIGHALCFVSVFLVGLDGQFVSESMFTIMCTLRKWCLSIGFTLGYGAMFSKVWRVHRLTTKNKSATKHKIQPWKLYLLVATLVGIEVIYLTIWTLVDPLKRVMESFQPEESANLEEDIRIMPQLEHCESDHNNIWLGITYSFKGLLLIFGLFLAYETRSLKVRHINDSRLVAMSIYNVAVLCLITTPVTMIISNQQDATFAFVALAIIFSSMITMGLVYIPKVIEVIREGSEKSDRSSAPDGGTTKEEEERYQKLLSENEQLQKILEQKEERLRQLRQKLEDKNAIRKLESGGGDDDHPGGNSAGLISADLVESADDSKTKDVASKGGMKNNNVEQIEVLETYYTEPSDSAIGTSKLSVHTHTPTTTEFELSESYL
ncbi:Gamma-aminobutyric acid type B receptor subunit 1 [Orchesella cincta]|uniref:Gamma-aminobutyric acid type B receptor subunit 1 n=1 Tax=Orchesella cincta TaxID=48709 RepID=A0A1D2NC33_ORCCI|nr:Gamma-aminobutyric acid type B receptor subunit 1 [Orchesella cincta]